MRRIEIFVDGYGDLSIRNYAGDFKPGVAYVFCQEDRDFDGLIELEENEYLRMLVVKLEAANRKLAEDRLGVK